MEILPDTSAVVDGRVTERVEDGFDGTAYVAEAVVGELEAQANDGRESGWDGLEELQRLADYADDGAIAVEYVGDRPGAVERRGAAEGEIDALIRDLAAEHGATLLTSDIVQSEVAEAKGLDVEYVEPRTDDGDDDAELALERYFDEETMSVHLKTGVAPMAKRGSVGEMSYETVADEPLDEETARSFASEVVDVARSSADGFVELSQPGMTIAQIRDLRIAVAEPPFAGGARLAGPGVRRRTRSRPGRS